MRPSAPRHLRHTLLNLTGIAAPLLVGVLVMPTLVHRLGPAGFGLLGLAWAVLEYFTLFDAGLGRATTRAIAGRLGGGEDAALSELVSASLLAQLGFGIVGAAMLAGLAPAFVHVLLRVPDTQADTAVRVLRILAAMLPVVLLSLAARSILEAAERFDLSNALRAPTSAATFLVPAALAAMGRGLPGIMVGLLVARVVACVAALLLVRWAVPSLRWHWPRSWRPLAPLLAFGGWVTVSNVLSPLLLLLDRFVLGAIAGLAAVGYYTAPYEASWRLLIVPAALVSAVFPAASAHAARREHAELAALYVTTLRVLLAAMLGLVVVVVLLAPFVLELWLGAEVAAHGTTAFRILLCAVLLNALVHVPFAFVHALGLANLTARYHLLELVVHVPLTFLLVWRFGAAGAASAWAARVALDAVLVLGLARRRLGVGVGAALRRPGAWLLAAAAAAVPSLLVNRVAAHDLVLAGALVLAAALLYIGVVWRWVLSAREREAMLALRRGRALGVGA